MNVLNQQEVSKAFLRRCKAANLKLVSFLVLSAFPILVTQAHAQTAFERLSSLLAAAPEGGWVKASTGNFSDAWPTGADAASWGSPMAIIQAWSSFAWDSSRENLLLWGGGHANYSGNEMYGWNGATGAWGRGSLPSRLDANGFVIGGPAPQAAHTYDNNIYLPVNDMFLTFGGAAYPNGGGFEKTDGITVSRAGPYMWDPTKADANKVGGTDGSGWNTDNIARGGNMWLDRGPWMDGVQPQFVSTTANRIENGKDIVYLTADKGASGFGSLYRYTVGEVRNGGQDQWEKIGVSYNTAGFQTVGTIDSTHNLYIKTATITGIYTSDLTVWDLDKANATNPNSNADIGINLVNEDGSDFKITGFYGMDYDPATNSILLWDGKDGGGNVWSAKVITGADGKIGTNTTWTIHEIPSATVDHPHGNFVTAVLGKWHYDSALNAFIALDEATNLGGGVWNADVWLYKPMSAAVVPEPETYALLLAGLGVVGCVTRRRNHKSRKVNK